MSQHQNNQAFIDGNNLYLGALSQHIQLDYRKLRLYLKNRFGVEQAFLFIGYDPRRRNLYRHLTDAGFILVFKPTVNFKEHGRTTMKGNVDAELVLYSAAIQYHKYRQAIIISSDGDFTCLIRYLLEKDKLLKVITPTQFYSSLFHPFTKHILPLKQFAAKIST